MDNPERPFGRRLGDAGALDAAPSSGRAGPAACDQILHEIARAAERGTTLTIWDLPDATGLALHEAFAALRTLEFGKLVRIHDDPADPFGARLTLRDDTSGRTKRLGTD